MIENEYDLLKMYYEAYKQVISEFSGSIQEDINELNEEILDYAKRNKLKIDFIKEIPF